MNMILHNPCKNKQYCEKQNQKEIYLSTNDVMDFHKEVELWVIAFMFSIFF